MENSGRILVWNDIGAQKGKPGGVLANSAFHLNISSREGSNLRDF